MKPLQKTRKDDTSPGSGEKEEPLRPHEEGEPGRTGSGSTALDRFLSFVLLAGFGFILALSIFLTPDPSGIGTHTQLGLPPCGLYEQYGIPCLSCGMTTAFTHMVRAQPLSGFRANPLGALMFLAVVAGLAMNLWAVATGWSFFRFLERRDWTRIGLSFVALSLLSWGYKVAAVLLASG